MKLFLPFLILFSLNGFAQDEDLSLDEMLEQEKYEAATVLIKERIAEGPVKIEDILLLGRIYEGLGLDKKAIKTYLFGIRKLHSSAWKDIKSYKQLKEVLPDLREPNKESLLLAYKVGLHYYDLYLVSESTEDFSRRILDTALKYLIICEHFKFNLPKTKYFLGLVYKEYENYKLSSIKFLEAWKLFEKQKKVDKEREQKIRLMVGESFVNYGHIRAGNAHLRSVYYYKNGSRYLRNYASEYLDEFLGTSVGGSLGLTIGNDSNVLLGNSFGTETIKASNYSNKNASIYLGHTPSYSSSYNFSLGYTEELYTESALKDNDSRSLTFTSSWDYKKFEKSIWTLSYYLTKNYARPSSTEEFDPDSDSHQITISWQKVLRKSLLTVSVPLTKSLYESGSHADSKGLGLSWEPITFSKYWNPTFGIDLTTQEEDEGFDDSKNAVISFSNSFSFSDLFAGSIDLSFENNTNTSDSLAYTERVLSLGLFYSFENLDGLSLEASLSSEANTPKSGTADTRIKTGLGLSYIL